MFFKRPGVLKTENMMKIFDKFTVNDELKNLLEQNQEDAEDVKRIETVCKQALGKLSSKTDDMELEVSNQRQGDFKKRRDYLCHKLAETAVGMDTSFSIIEYALNYDKVQVISAPKSERNEINKLYTAAKNEKRRLKLIQKKIRDCLKKWESYHKKASALVEQLKKYKWHGTIGGASYTDTYSQYMSKSDLKGMAKYTEQYNNLCVDMLELKQKIIALFKQAGRGEESIAAALKDIDYPKLEEPKSDQAT